MRQRILWAWKVLCSNTFVVATEKEAVCKIDLRDPYSFESVLMLSAQQGCLKDFIERLQGISDEHEQAASENFGTSLRKPKKRGGASRSKSSS